MNATCLLTLFLLWATVIQAGPITVKPQQADNNLNFIENKGQVLDQYGRQRHDIDFKTGQSGLNLFIGKGRLHYQWGRQLASNEGQALQTAMYRMDVTLVGANPHAQVVYGLKQAYYERYFLPGGDKPGAMAFAYQSVTYKEVYPNIDWVLYVRNNTIEYDFVVRPGGKVSDIQLQYGGQSALLVNDGALTAVTPMGSLTEHAPVSYQEDGTAIKTLFVLQGNSLGFNTAAYKGTLVIDPVLSWSTYYGGSGSDIPREGCVTGDPYGNVYLGGNTNSTGNIATVGSFQDTLTANTDGFLVKFNSSGTRLWATYYGGPGTENIYGVACDHDGNVYLSGYTNSTTDIATSGAYQSTIGGNNDAFLVKFDSSGARKWGSYFGGSSAEQCYGITCDTNNNVYITGYTVSTSGIATAGACQTTLGGSSDCFLAKFNSSGSRLWATYYGGSGADQGWGVKCDNSNNVFLTGLVQSTGGIATSGAYQTTYGGSKDGFLAKFDSTGTRLWGTYFGGTGVDQAFAVTCDEAGSAYITGYTGSLSGIATQGSFQDTLFPNTDEGFLTKFSSSGSLQWSTYYGGHGGATLQNISYFAGHVYFTGLTNSADSIATPGSSQDTLDGAQDALLVKFDTAGHRIWGAYFGVGSENGYGVFCNSRYKVVLGGATSSSGLYTTPGCYQSGYNSGNSDGFLVMFNDCVLTSPDTLIGHDTVCRDGAYMYYVPSMTGANSYTWTLPSGWMGSSTSDTIHITAGNNSDTIRVTANYACGISTQRIKAITVSALPLITPAGTSKICNSDSLTLTASAGASYQWLRDDTAISGAHSNAYTVYDANHYSVIVTSANGCADTSAMDTVIVHPTPAPVITVSGRVLSTGTYASYQWNRNGAPITGAVNQVYTIVIDSGNYTVTVTDTNGCTGTSAVYSPPTAAPNVHANDIVGLYPNPTNGMVYINATQKIQVSITTMDGRQMGVYNGPGQIDLGRYPNGIYVFRVTKDDGTVIRIGKIEKAETR